MRLCGLDEAGRGAFAGPLVGVAIVIDDNFKLGLKIRDGKLIQAKQREKIALTLAKSNAEIYIEKISVEEINEVGIGKANIAVFERLVSKIKADSYIVDGNLRINNARSFVDADAFVPEVILAGIVAKVERDKIMRELHNNYPEYNWFENKGYGTKKHLEKIKELGITPMHRTAYVRSAMRDRH